MNRVKTREYVFKLLFCKEFHNVEEMPKQCSLFLDNLENASEEDKDYITERVKKISDLIPEIVPHHKSGTPAHSLLRISR